MTIRARLDEYAGLPVHAFATSPDPGSGPLPDAAAVAWRVAVDGPLSWRDSLHALLDSVDADRVEALVVGYYSGDDLGEDYPGNVLAGVADRLPALRSLFLAEMPLEEMEISWIIHESLDPLLRAFPRLERLDVRGHQELELGPIASESLRTLRFETGGLPAEIVRAVAASDLPNLEHLDFWLGVEGYGCDVVLGDLAPFLSGERFPALRHLGLANSEFQDEIAAAVAGAPVLARLESLDLSMGVLTDAGAEALLSGQPLTHLRSLDLHRNSLSDEMARRVLDTLPGVQVDLSERRDREDLYVAVSE
ncbi:STM4015 family protein [Actinomadura harenae]|uniref:Leucine-rich repeat domain-containing protein n=1 Tax=Actinomadura harenae TaxID=2483351 RepID=A0A3M2MGJ0_9ACTN|nr:STM4015 family protein [Actinomadura harenae]RMI46358.1 leucine-rich repeat domain-containing protein [Actinomadura harenae]